MHPASRREPLFLSCQGSIPASKKGFLSSTPVQSLTGFGGISAAVARFARLLVQGDVQRGLRAERRQILKRRRRFASPFWSTSCLFCLWVEVGAPAGQALEVGARPDPGGRDVAACIQLSPLAEQFGVLVCLTCLSSQA